MNSQRRLRVIEIWCPMVAHVKNWIDEFKLRGTQERLGHAAAAEYRLKTRTTIQW